MSVVNRRLMWLAVAGGVAIGVIWTLSPMTVLFALGVVPLVRWTAHGLPPAERRRLAVLLVIAIALRVAAIAILFATADRNAGSFATLFGDEQFLELRALWVRNLALQIPISHESFIYSGSGTGWTSYIPVAAAVQLLVGPAPYGMRLFDLLLFLAAALALFRAARRSFGAATAFGGLAMILWMPSLFAWSISALKEPLYLFFVTASILGAVHACRASTRWPVRAAMIVLVLISVMLVESVRPGGRTLMIGSLVAGAAFRLLAWNRRVAFVSAIAAPLVIALTLSTVPRASDLVLKQIEWGARWHRGHVFTKGHSYKALDARFYIYNSTMSDVYTMTPPEAARYVIRQVWAFGTVPLPWQATSRAELLIIPEQLLIYGALLLMPIGLACASRLDPVLTSFLSGYIAISWPVIAITSGNVGTVVRHRALVFPYIVWFSALGAAWLLRWLSQSHGTPTFGSHPLFPEDARA
jgi:hypothetical protein